MVEEKLLDLKLLELNEGTSSVTVGTDKGESWRRQGEGKNEVDEGRRKRERGKTWRGKERKTETKRENIRERT